MGFVSFEQGLGPALLFGAAAMVRGACSLDKGSLVSTAAWPNPERRKQTADFTP
jgi:hypothetical protein